MNKQQYENNTQRLYNRICDRLNRRVEEHLEYCEVICTDKTLSDILPKIQETEHTFAHSCLSFAPIRTAKFYREKYYFHTLEEALRYYSKYTFTLYLSWMNELILVTPKQRYVLFTLNTTGELCYRAMTNKNILDKYIVRELITNPTYIESGHLMLGMNSALGIKIYSDGRVVSRNKSFGGNYIHKIYPGGGHTRPPNKGTFKKGVHVPSKRKV